MGIEAAACYGMLVVHLAGQTTCTNPECDTSPDLERHPRFLTTCRTCYRSRGLSDRWGLESLAERGLLLGS